MLARRRPDSHKGDFGHLLVLAGSPGMAGAGFLASFAGLRSGAGLVTLAAAGSACRPLVAARPEIMCLSLPEDEQGLLTGDAPEQFFSFAARADAIVAGPGLDDGETTRRLCRELPARCEKPLLLDAQALNHLAGSPGSLVAAATPVVVTPHPGEMARLAGLDKSAVQAGRRETALAFSRENRAVTVLKGHRTVIAEPGGRYRVNLTGNPGMATAGSGDVLSGVIGGLLAQGLEAFEAACLGVRVHGLAGDLAAREKGEISLVAGDILEKLPAAFRL